MTDLKVRIQEAWEYLKILTYKHRVLKRERQKLVEALLFYADPDIYIGIGFKANSPCGEFIYDFDTEHSLGKSIGRLPGKTARKAIKESLGLK